MGRIKTWLLLLFILVTAALQSTPFYANYFAFDAVKIDLVFVLLTLIVFVKREEYAFLFVVFGGFVCDQISSSYFGFYLIAFFFSLLPLVFFRMNIAERILPFFLLTVVGVSILKGLITVAMAALFVNTDSAVAFFKKIFFLEIFINVIAAVPVFCLFRILKRPLGIREQGLE